MRIGIFGGSFNPVHNGHLRLAERALEELNLEKVIFVPSYQTPLKKEDLFPASLRLGLLRAAVKKYPRFFVSSCEIQRKGRSFTVDTLRFFKKRFKKNAVFYFLSGADALKNLHRWRSLKQVLALCRFVVMTRPGFSMRPLETAGPISFVALDALSISSSDVRARLRQGRPINHLVPSRAADLLVQHFRKTKGGGTSKSPN